VTAPVRGRAAPPAATPFRLVLLLILRRPAALVFAVALGAGLAARTPSQSGTVYFGPCPQGMYWSQSSASSTPECVK
jgi:hypothetical protein